MSKKELELLLLEKAKSIKPFRREQTFNVFEATGVSYYEIPMTNFLYELLRTDGIRNMNRSYLKQFFREVLKFQDSDNDLSKELEGAYVHREYRTDEGRYIDLVIDTPNRFIPIEVKITANEGYNQCLDYFLESKKRNERKQDKKDWYLFFLTLDSHLPESMKDFNERVRPICWGEQIINWLNNILEIERHEEEYALYVAIEQYRNALENFTAESKAISKMAIEWDEDDIKALDSLQKSFQDAKVKFLVDFFDEIHSKLRESKEFRDVSIRIDKDIEQFYRSKRCNYPGINCEVRTNEDKNYVLSIRLEIEDSPYIGFIVSADKDAIENAKNWAIDDCIIQNHHEDLIKDNPHGWIYYKDIIPDDSNPLSFRDHGAYLFLRDKLKLKKIIDKIVAKFDELNGWLKVNES